MATYAYYLIDPPPMSNQNNIEYIVNDPTVVNFLDRFGAHFGLHPAKMDQQLIVLLRHYRPAYFPQQARNFVQIPHWKPTSCGQLALFHTYLHQLVYYKHQHLKLIKHQY